MGKLSEILGKTIIVVIVIAIMALIFGLPVMWLWNDFMPDLFDIRKIKFWEAVEMNLLCGLLFQSSSKSS